MASTKKALAAKARRLMELHREPKLLVLPNIWDPLGARMLESLGYPAVATASAAVAWSLGYDDGERIAFETMLDAIARIASAVDVPLAADIERGYAGSAGDLAVNVRAVIHAGAVGINLEDSLAEGGALRPVAEQAERIHAARAAAKAERVPLVINARVDTYLRSAGQTAEDRFEETVRRGRAYLGAGADCLYPIGLADLETLVRLREACDGAALNVLARLGAPSMRDLEAAGIARLSVGPGLLEASLGRMKRIATELLNYGSYDIVASGAVSRDEIQRYLSKGSLP